MDDQESSSVNFLGNLDGLSRLAQLASFSLKQCEHAAPGSAELHIHWGTAHAATAELAAAMGIFHMGFDAGATMDDNDGGGGTRSSGSGSGSNNERSASHSREWSNICKWCGSCREQGCDADGLSGQWMQL
eukprot:comp16073_c0_seq1/m.25272 comp16073_c0_seq1/g.25272  ORF comp16073_c0_seq1/g.25272 comp16073_c0_seq1/m.25272 type:complete len:131 (-) comp16073_c0_seq1:45-437(-)